MKLLFCVSASKWLRSHHSPLSRSIQPWDFQQMVDRASERMNECGGEPCNGPLISTMHCRKDGLGFFSLRKIAQSQHKKPISKSTEVAFSIIFLGRKFKGRLCLMVSDPLVGIGILNNLWVTSGFWDWGGILETLLKLSWASQMGVGLVVFGRTARMQ